MIDLATITTRDRGTIDEHLRRQFEAAYARGRPRPIDDFLPPRETPCYLPTLEELVHVELEFSWKDWSKRTRKTKSAGTAARPQLVEDYLQRFPTLGQHEILLRLLEQEVCLRDRFGDRPAISEYRRRFPQLDWENRKLVPASSIAQGERNGGRSAKPACKRTESLMRTKPFCDLPEAVVNTIAGYVAECEFDAGKAIVAQGNRTGQLVVLLDGIADITVTDQRQVSHVICRNIQRAAIGEFSLLTGAPHCANVVAVTRVRALILNRKDFFRTLQQFPSLTASFVQLMSSRLGQDRVDAFYDKITCDYRIKQRLGRGGMAVVYEGEEVSTGRKVALKMMQHPLAYDQASVERFRHEAELVASLRHEHIVEVYDCYSAYNTLFMVMEYCDGPTLGQLLKRCGPLTESQAKPILGQLASALAYAHRRGVIHRDVKPANVLFHNGQVRLSDFGVARSLLSTGLTQKGHLIGTPRYMSPEQLVGDEVDQRADIYAFGCIAYELLSGEPMCGGEHNLMELLQLQLTRPSLVPPTRQPLGREMQSVLEQSLAFYPEHRRLDLDRVAAWSGKIDTGLLLRANGCDAAVNVS